jgi:hypothetical protein
MRSRSALARAFWPSLSGQPPFSELGATLALAELYQTAGRLEDAIGLLQQLHEATTEPLVRLSLCDLLFADHDYEGVVDTASSVTNDSDVSVETLHLRGAALVALGHGAGAINAFRDALSRTAGRDAGLLKVIRYDRAPTYVIVSVILTPSESDKSWSGMYFACISCAPLLIGNAIAGGVGLLAGAVLLVPRLIGVLVLSIFIWLTNPRRIG